MSTEAITPHGYVRALAAAVRDGALSPEQWEQLVTLLHSVGTTITLAPRAQETYPDNDAEALGYLVGTWEPVQRAHTESSGDGPLQRRGARRLAWPSLAGQLPPGNISAGDHSGRTR